MWSAGQLFTMKCSSSFFLVVNILLLFAAAPLGSQFPSAGRTKFSHGGWIHCIVYRPPGFTWAKCEADATWIFKIYMAQNVWDPGNWWQFIAVVELNELNRPNGTHRYLWSTKPILISLATPTCICVLFYRTENSYRSELQLKSLSLGSFWKINLVKCSRIKKL